MLRPFEERWIVDCVHCVWANGYHIARFSRADGDQQAFERTRLAAAAPKLTRALAALVEATRTGTMNADHLIEGIMALELAGYSPGLE